MGTIRSSGLMVTERQRARTKQEEVIEGKQRGIDRYRGAHPCAGPPSRLLSRRIGSFCVFCMGRGHNRYPAEYPVYGGIRIERYPLRDIEAEKSGRYACQWNQEGEECDAMR